VRSQGDAVHSAEPDAGDAEVLAAIHGVGHLVRRLFQFHARLWHDLVDEDITGPQFTVLGVLHLRGPMDQRTLGGHARLDKSTTAPIVERLRRRGLVEITRDGVDRRRKLLRVTPAGSDLVTALAPLARQVGDRMLTPLDESERRLLLSLLERIA
jgi:DNA-binding MarR family transcriptional regulator